MHKTKRSSHKIKSTSRHYSNFPWLADHQHRPPRNEGCSQDYLAQMACMWMFHLESFQFNRPIWVFLCDLCVAVLCWIGLCDCFGIKNFLPAFLRNFLIAINAHSAIRQNTDPVLCFSIIVVINSNNWCGRNKQRPVSLRYQFKSRQIPVERFASLSCGCKTQGTIAMLTQPCRLLDSNLDGQIYSKFAVVNCKLVHNSVPDPDLEVRGGGRHPDP